MEAITSILIKFILQLLVLIFYELLTVMHCQSIVNDLFPVNELCHVDAS